MSGSSTALQNQNSLLNFRISLTWFGSIHHSSVGLEHCIVDGGLVRRELSIGREGATDIGTVAVVLSAHVKHTHISVL